MVKNLARYRIHSSVHKNGLRLDKAKKGGADVVDVAAPSTGCAAPATVKEAHQATVDASIRRRAKAREAQPRTIAPQRSQSRHPRRGTRGESHERPSNRLDTPTAASPGPFLRKTRRVRRRTSLPPETILAPKAIRREEALRSTPALPPAPNNLAPEAPLHRTSPSPNQSAASAIPSEPTRRPNSLAAKTTPPPQQPRRQNGIPPRKLRKTNSHNHACDTTSDVLRL